VKAPARSRASKADLVHVGAVAAFKVVVSVLVLSSGFSAISDDDFSRVVIAEKFAASPALDPSGTSWLPVPFWLNGIAMMIFGRSLEVARVTAVALGAVGAVLCYCAARRFGANPLGALLGAVFAAGFPYSAYLGAATVPEALTAGLVVLGTACLVRRADSPSPDEKPSDWPRLERLAPIIGGACLLLATGSRYEAWPAALVFAGFGGVYALRSVDRLERRNWLFGVGLALAMPLAWLAHGIARHDDAFFFVKRVAAYQAALGTEPTSLWTRLARTPVGLFWGAPTLVSAVGLSALFGVVANLVQQRPFISRELKAYRPALWVSLAILAFLIAGDLRESTATHHAERTLLPIWTFLSMLLGSFLVRSEPAAKRPPKLLLAIAFSGVSLLLAMRGFDRDLSSARESTFVDRRNEIAVGLAAHARFPEEKLWIDTDDYGYFAVMAAFGAPERVAVTRSHDPRKKGDERQRDVSAVVRSGTALAVLSTKVARSLVADGDASIVLERERLALVRIK
jgi:4-amino-4-deoxy-L-arabinose transferase-like glycosyltransferase